jgi:uncharacterized LabA/DUF88 family protein/cold shock CspA family protein
MAVDPIRSCGVEERVDRKIGIYVDVENITMNGGRGMQYDVLRQFATRGGGDAVRMNAYVRFDEERAKSNDPTYERVLEFHSRIRDSGFKVVEKPIRWYKDQQGQRYGKANADLDMAVDMLLQSERLDRVLLVSGDGDFVKVVEALQNRGLRLEAIGFDNVSKALQTQADLYMSGYLIPGLLPEVQQAEGDERKPWGEEGSRVRGTCHWFDAHKGYGFLRFLDHINDRLWTLDSRDPESPYRTAFLHASALQDDGLEEDLPNRELVFEFTLRSGDKGFVAEDPIVVNEF